MPPKTPPLETHCTQTATRTLAEIIGDHQVNIVTQDHELCDAWMTRFTFTDPLTFKMADRSMELFNIDEGGCAGFYDSSRHMVYRYDDREKVGTTV